MANYIEDFNSKLDWAMPFQRTGKFPLDRTNMFESYNDAVAYAKGDGSDSRGLGGTSYVGQVIVVFENDVVTVYKINADRTIEALTSKSGIDALDTVINTLSDNKNATLSLTQVDGLITDLSISTVALSNTYNEVVYPTDTGDKTFTPAISGQTLDEAIFAVESNVSTLVSSVLENEEVTAAAFTEIKESAGYDEHLKYVVDSNANYISAATTLSEADSLLDEALRSEVIARENAISSLSSSSSSDLTAEITARKAVDGQTGQTYVANTSAKYISAATSLNNADVLLNNAISNLKITSVTGTELTNLGTNVKEAYKFVDGNGTQHGEYIKEYKDQTLKSVELNEQSLDFTYILSDGKESTVNIDVSKFLAESEFVSGVTSNSSGQVYVKIDSASEAFLTTSASGVKISGVQTAIDTAINNLDATISDDNTHVDITIVQTDGKLTSVNITESDIASASALATEISDRTTAISSEASARQSADNTLTTNLNAEIAARKAVDGQTGQTYVANGSAYTYISAATSLNDADKKLNEAVEAVNTRIDNLDATKSGSTTHVNVKVVQTNGLISSVTVGETDIASASALTAEITARKAVDGQSGQTYAANTSAKHISAATSLNNADVLLNNAITAETSNRATAITNAVNNLSGTTSGNGTHVDVTVVQSAGKITSVVVSESDIASASALSSLTTWCSYLSGHTTATSLTSVPITKRLCIATVSSSQTLGINGSLTDGRELHIIIKNSSTNDITITIPSTMINTVGENLIIYGSSYAEINLVSDGTNIYYRGI